MNLLIGFVRGFLITVGSALVFLGLLALLGS